MRRPEGPGEGATMRRRRPAALRPTQDGCSSDTPQWAVPPSWPNHSLRTTTEGHRLQITDKCHINGRATAVAGDDVARSALSSRADLCWRPFFVPFLD